MNDLNSIYNVIKTLRENRGLSIRKLAELSGVAATFISCIERAKKTPSPATLSKLAPHLGVTYEYLMFVAGYIKPNLQLTELESNSNTDNKYLESSNSVISSIIQDLLKRRIIIDENNIPENVLNMLISAIKLEISIQNKKLKK